MISITKIQGGGGGGRVGTLTTPGNIRVKNNPAKLKLMKKIKQT